MIVGLECSEDGKVFQQLRICHLFRGNDENRFDIHAGSPKDSFFRAVFTNSLQNAGGRPIMVIAE